MYSSSSGLSSYDPSAYSRRGKADRTQKTSDSYDFDISSDGFAESPVFQSTTRRMRETNYDSMASARFSGATRRSSIDDRAKEILERTRANKPVQHEEVDYKSLQSEFAELLQGVQLPESKAPDELESARVSTSSESPSPRGMPRKYASTSSLGTLGSPDGDSLDISAADLEVGAFAARKMKEKAADRRRRMSFDQPMYTPPKEAKGSASPEVLKNRRASMGSLGGVGTFQMSTALSSIHQSKTSFDSNRYGMAERSDDDIYKMLNITAQGNDVSAEVDRLRTASDVSGHTANKKVRREKEEEEQEEEEEEEQFQDDFEAHDDEEEEEVERKEPRGKNTAVREYEGDYTEDYEYTDDFEENSPSRPVQPAVQAAPPTSSAPLHPSIDMGRLNTVEQIMQRWYTDPTGVSESMAMAISSSATAQLSTTGATMEKERAEEEEEKLDSPVFAHLKPQVLSAGDHTPYASTLAEGGEPSRAEEEGGLIAAVGNANLVTSISTAPPLMSALSLPSWTAEDFGGDRDHHAESDEADSQHSAQSRESRHSLDSKPRGSDAGGDSDDDGGRGGGGGDGYHSDSSASGGHREAANNERRESLAEKQPPRTSVTFSATLEKVFKQEGGESDGDAASAPMESQSASEPRDVRRSSRSSRYDDAGDEDGDSADVDMDLKAMRRKFVPPSKASTQPSRSLVRRVPTSADTTKPRASSESGRATVTRSTASSSSSLGRREHVEERPVQSPGKAKLAASALAKIQRRRAGEPAEKKARTAAASESKRSSSRERTRNPTPARSPSRSRDTAASQDGIFTKLLLDAVEKVRTAGAGAEEGFGLLSSEAENELKCVVRDLMSDVHTLQSKERELALREKAIAIKEAVASARDRGSGVSQSTGWRELQERLTVLQLENDRLLEERDALARQLEVQSRELDQVKAQAFRQQQDNRLAENQAHRESLGLAPSSSLAALHAPLETLAKEAELQKAYKRLSERVATPQAGVPALVSKGLSSGTAPDVTVAREDLEALLRDYATQERLLDGFGKENERLAQQLKEREAAFCAREALFLDRQEAQNKELNYLRGRAGPTDARSLRNELALDAKLRFLQEQLAEQAEAAGQRERALQQTVATLREESKALREEVDHLRSADVEQVRQEAQALRVERAAMQEKLRWLLDNQRLVDADTEELHRLRKEVQRLRDEVLRRGGQRALDKLQDSAGTAAGGAEADRGNSSTLSASTAGGGGGGGGRRNASDVRRIKELEATVRDLREAMAKRFPDSLTGLIHAAKKDKEESREVTGLREKVNALQSELDDAREQYERKLRAMRQEFERAKAAFAAASASATDAAASPLSPSSAREGAGEVERVRQFYTRKIEDLTRRHEQQLRALKRGVDPSRDLPPPPPPPPPPPQPSAEAGEEAVLRKRVQMLEEELMLSAREVGTLRARLVAQDSSPTPPSVTPSPSPAQLTREEVDRLVEERVREAMARVSPPPPPAAPATPVPAAQPQPQPSVVDLEKVAALWLAEKEKYILEVRSERARADDLAREVASLGAQVRELSAQRQPPKPPSLLQFQLLEQQLHEVETGLRRRERDLLAALEETKAAAALERQHQEVRHGAELAEKDRLLEKFARDLHLLLAELRKWQQAQGAQ